MDRAPISSMVFVCTLGGRKATSSEPSWSWLVSILVDLKQEYKKTRPQAVLDALDYPGYPGIPGFPGFPGCSDCPGCPDALSCPDALGFPDALGGLYLESEDLAKIGQLVLNKGVWDNQQVVSTKWMEESTSRLL